VLPMVGEVQIVCKETAFYQHFIQEYDIIK